MPSRPKSSKSEEETRQRPGRVRQPWIDIAVDPSSKEGDTDPNKHRASHTKAKRLPGAGESQFLLRLAYHRSDLSRFEQGRKHLLHKLNLLPDDLLLELEDSPGEAIAP